MDAINSIGTAAPAPAAISFVAAQRAARAYGTPATTAPAPTSRVPSNAQRLVAAVVPGHVDFSGSAPAVAQGALPFYRNPADKNAAATLTTNTGRALDLNA